MTAVILISGPIGSGKDTLAKHLEDKLNCKHFKFANKLRDYVALFLGLYKEDLSHRVLDIFEDRKVKENNIVFVSPTNPDIRFTTRQLMQKFGTDAMRNGMYSNVWVDTLLLDVALTCMRPSSNSVVISDVRFLNEQCAFDNIPEYYYPVKVYIDKTDFGKPTENHESESHLKALYEGADIILRNDYDIGRFKTEAYSLILKHLPQL